MTLLLGISCKLFGVVVMVRVRVMMPVSVNGKGKVRKCLDGSWGDVKIYICVNG